jgi:hypothetical protein
MADERLLAPVRRFWTDAEVTSAYEAIFRAYHSRLEKVTVIIGKGTEGDSASAQVVVNAEDYLRWMDALETRLQEIEAAAAGETGGPSDTTHADFCNRYVST